MTTPKIETVSKFSSRFYVHPNSKEQVPGVTSILNMLPKTFLRYWAAKLTAETAFDEFGTLASFVVSQDRDAAVDWLKGSSTRFTKAAADVGTEVHNLIEKRVEEGRLAQQHPDIQVYLDHFEDFLDTWQPTFLENEPTVWSTKHKYAGSLDAIVEIEGERVLMDWKTTRSGVHEEVALQITAYAKADFILRPDGTEDPLPEVNAGAVLHIRPEGYKIVPVAISDEIFEVFLALQKVFKWEHDIKRGVLGRPLKREVLS